MHTGYYNSATLAVAWKKPAINNQRKYSIRGELIEAGLIKPAKTLAA